MRKLYNCIYRNPLHSCKTFLSLCYKSFVVVTDTLLWWTHSKVKSVQTFFLSKLQIKVSDLKSSICPGKVMNQNSKTIFRFTIRYFTGSVFNQIKSSDLQLSFCPDNVPNQSSYLQKSISNLIFRFTTKFFKFNFRLKSMFLRRQSDGEGAHSVGDGTGVLACAACKGPTSTVVVGTFNNYINK